VLLPGSAVLRDVHLRGPESSGAVALTFDDGPNGRCTEAVLDALAEAHAPATFFVIGANVAGGRNDALLARMVYEGHTIGSHSQTHGVRPLFLHYLTAWELEESTAQVAAALRRAGVDDPPPIRFFRPPFGFLLGPSARAVADQGLAVVGWTVSVKDWRSGLDADTITGRILEQVRAGDVIVLHDGIRTHQRSIERCTDRAVVAETVRALLPALAARGLRVIALTDLLGMERPGANGSPVARSTACAQAGHGCGRPGSAADAPRSTRSPAAAK
jgi:peptidoglycan/xylan/chitin deacetylase (PgdA/CDA1 family)